MSQKLSQNLSQKSLEILSDAATAAHTRIQQDFEYINPVIGVSQKMRALGIPADAMTIDCLRTNKRILIVLHDEQPDQVRYQFTERDIDPSLEFSTLALSQLDVDVLYGWMASTFTAVT